MKMELNKDNVGVLSTQIVLQESEYTMSYLTADELERQLKHKLIQLMVEELYKNNHIEFTKESSIHNTSRIFRARIATVNKDVICELRKGDVI